jgi:hypothetical protein
LGSKRQQIFGEHERVRRQYRKRSAEYWSQTIKETRSKQRRVSKIPSPEQQETESQITTLETENLHVWEIKEKLKDLGIQTRFRKMEKLREILRQALITE